MTGSDENNVDVGGDDGDDDDDEDDDDEDDDDDMVIIYDLGIITKLPGSTFNCQHRASDVGSDRPILNKLDHGLNITVTATGKQFYRGMLPSKYTMLPGRYRFGRWTHFH